MRSVACRRGKNKVRVETTSSSQPLLAASARPTTTPVNTRRRSTSPQALPTKRPAGSQQEDRSPYPKMARTTEESSAKRQLVYGSIDEMEQELDNEMANMLDAARTCEEDMAIETPRRVDRLLRDAYQLQTSPPTALSATGGSSLSSFKWAANMRNWRPTIGINIAQHAGAHKSQNTPIIDLFGFVDEADDGARGPREDETSRAAEKVTKEDPRPTKKTRHSNMALAEDRSAGPLPKFKDLRMSTKDKPRHGHVNPLRLLTHLEFTTTRCILLHAKQRRKNTETVTDVRVPWQLYYEGLRLYLCDTQGAEPKIVKDLPEVDAIFLAMPRNGTDRQVDESRILFLIRQQERTVLSYQMAKFHGLHFNAGTTRNLGTPLLQPATKLHGRLLHTLKYRTTRRVHDHDYFEMETQPETGPRMPLAQASEPQEKNQSGLRRGLPAASAQISDELQEDQSDEPAVINRKKRLQVVPHRLLLDKEVKLKATDALTRVKAYQSLAASTVLGVDEGKLRPVSIRKIQVWNILRPVCAEHMHNIKEAMLKKKILKPDYRAILVQQINPTTGKVTLVALDGQHRILAAQAAISERPSLLEIYGSIRARIVTEEEASSFVQFLLIGRPQGERAHRHFSWIEKVVVVRRARDEDPSLIDRQFSRNDKMHICAELLYEHVRVYFSLITPLQNVAPEFVRAVDMNDEIFERFHDFVLRYFPDQLKVSPARVRPFIAAIYRNPNMAFKILEPKPDANAHEQALELNNIHKDIVTYLRRKHVNLTGGFKKWSAAVLKLRPPPSYEECIKAAKYFFCEIHGSFRMPKPNFLNRQIWNERYLNLLSSRILEMRNRHDPALDPLQYALLEPDTWTISRDSTALLLDTEALPLERLEETIDHLIRLSASQGSDVTRFAFFVGPTEPLKSAFPPGFKLDGFSLSASFVLDESVSCDGRVQLQGTENTNGWALRLMGFRLGHPLTRRQLLAEVGNRRLMWLSFVSTRCLGTLLQSFTRNDTLEVVVSDLAMSASLYFLLLTTGLAGHFFTADGDFVDKRNCPTNVDNSPDSSDDSDEDCDQDGLDEETAQALVLYGANLPVEDEEYGGRTTEEEPKEESEEDLEEGPEEDPEDGDETE